MNIFWLDDDPNMRARYHCNKHIVKMPLETAQILCSAAHLNGYEDTPYKPTHQSHPCVKWAAASLENFITTIQHGTALCREFHVRYGKMHRSFDVIRAMAHALPDIEFPAVAGFPPPLCMPDQYKCENIVEAYRNYYRSEKGVFAKWPEGNTPTWMNSSENGTESPLHDG